MIESKLDRGRGPVATVLVQKRHAAPGRHRGGRRRMGPGARDARRQGPPGEGRRALAAGGDPRPVGRARGRRELRRGGGRERGRARSASSASARTARSRSAADQRRPRQRSPTCWPASRPARRRRSRSSSRPTCRAAPEAISVTLGKLGNEEVQVRVLHSAVGQITESRHPARQGLRRRGRRVQRPRHGAGAGAGAAGRRRHPLLLDHLRGARTTSRSWCKGKLAPVQREKFLGYAQILQVFEVKRLGKSPAAA